MCLKAAGSSHSSKKSISFPADRMDEICSEVKKDSHRDVSRPRASDTCVSQRPFQSAQVWRGRIVSRFLDEKCFEGKVFRGFSSKLARNIIFSENHSPVRCLTWLLRIAKRKEINLTSWYGSRAEKWLPSDRGRGPSSRECLGERLKLEKGEKKNWSQELSRNKRRKSSTLLNALHKLT